MKKKTKNYGVGFVWRESVYNNGYKCQECGAKLADLETGEPTENLGLDAGKEKLYGQFGYCLRCWDNRKLNPVVKFVRIDLDKHDKKELEAGRRAGYYNPED